MWLYFCSVTVQSIFSFELFFCKRKVFCINILCYKFLFPKYTVWRMDLQVDIQTQGSWLLSVYIDKRIVLGILKIYKICSISASNYIWPTDNFNFLLSKVTSIWTYPNPLSPKRAATTYPWFHQTGTQVANSAPLVSKVIKQPQIYYGLVISKLILVAFWTVCLHYHTLMNFTLCKRGHKHKNSLENCI